MQRTTRPTIILPIGRTAYSPTEVQHISRTEGRDSAPDGNAESAGITEIASGQGGVRTGEAFSFMIPTEFQIEYLIVCQKKAGSAGGPYFRFL